MGTGAAYLLIMARSLPSWSSTTWLREDDGGGGAPDDMAVVGEGWNGVLGCLWVNDDAVGARDERVGAREARGLTEGLGLQPRPSPPGTILFVQRVGVAGRTKACLQCRKPSPNFVADGIRRCLAA